MAVFTDITLPMYRDQFQMIEAAYDIEITSIEGITEGSSDSLFKVYTREYSDPLVLSIYETPDVTPGGMTAAEGSRIMKFIHHIAAATGDIVDSQGSLVKLAVPKPLRTKGIEDEGSPCLEVEFDGVGKCVTIVPFISGSGYSNQPEERIDPEEAFEVGRAVSAFNILARRYPHTQKFPAFDFGLHVHKLEEVGTDDVAMERLGYVLKDGQLSGQEASRVAEEYLSEMLSRGRRLLGEWERLSRDPAVLHECMIHGDVFVDNVLFGDDGRLYLLDFNETRRGPAGYDIGVALTSWASRNGEVVLLNVMRFLEGYDRVSSLDSRLLSLIPTFVQLGAFRWESFRVQRFTRHDPRHAALRSPDEFRLIQEGWEVLKPAFANLGSVGELRSELTGN